MFSTESSVDGLLVNTVARLGKGGGGGGGGGEGREGKRGMGKSVRSRAHIHLLPSPSKRTSTGPG